jgi:translation initiation factor IF-1
MTAQHGIVQETLPNARFRCRTDGGSVLLCHVSGNARMEVVRILPGDGVLIEPSPLDPGKGRIVGKDGMARRGS